MEVISVLLNPLRNTWVATVFFYFFIFFGEMFPFKAAHSWNNPLSCFVIDALKKMDIFFSNSVTNRFKEAMFNSILQSR